MADWSVQNHGTITLLIPLTPDAQLVADHDFQADAQRWGNGIAVEPRYLPPIIEDLIDRGFTVAGFNDTPQERLHAAYDGVVEQWRN